MTARRLQGVPAPAFKTDTDNDVYNRLHVVWQDDGRRCVNCRWVESNPLRGGLRTIACTDISLLLRGRSGMARVVVRARAGTDDKIAP
jgi:hypothetical protein